eukprot:203180-Hanusia_phi.AAC.2
MAKMSAMEGFERNVVWGELTKQVCPAFLHKTASDYGLFSQTALAKAELAAQYMMDMVEGGAKLLIFAHYLSVLDTLEQELCRAKANQDTTVGYIRIDGSVIASERQELVKRFQNRSDVRVAVLGLQAAGQGLTLTAASAVVFAELHVTPGVMVQAEDRVHRIGQTSSVNVHYLVARNTLDECIWRLLTRKLSVVSYALNGKKQKLEAEKVKGGNLSGGGGGEVSFTLPEDDEVFNELTTTPGKPDIRSFFEPRSGRPKKSRESALESKTASDFIDLCEIEESSTPVSGKHKSLVCLVWPELTSVRIALDDDEESAPVEPGSSQGQDGSEPTGLKRKLCFQVSGNTQRLYVYEDEEGKRLMGSVHPSELEDVTGACLPPFLKDDASALRCVREFHDKWKKLRAVEKKQLSDIVVSSSLTAALKKTGNSATRREAANLPTTQRHSSDLPFCDPDLCSWCGKRLDPDGQRVERFRASFCSHNCSEEFATCASSSSVRRQVQQDLRLLLQLLTRLAAVRAGERRLPTLRDGCAQSLQAHQVPPQ